MDRRVVAMILAGGRGSRLNIIARKRAKPAVPFGGIYRIIDFTMTNVMRSEVRHLGVLTQYRPTSLMEHLGDGESWDFHGLRATFSILPPRMGQSSTDWYKGTADAVFQNLDFLEEQKPDIVLILSGDHIYNMDYRPMIKWHLETKADLTIAGMKVRWDEVGRFGTMVLDGSLQVQTFLEKVQQSPSNTANMGVYCFNYETLAQELQNNCPKGRYDFGADVIPDMLKRRKVVAFMFDGYWRDVGQLNSFWEANQDALNPKSGLDLWSWKVRTNLEGRGQIYHPPAIMEEGAKVQNSLVSRGCVIKGVVRDSILSPGVVVEKEAMVVSSVIMHDCKIGKGAMVARAILDKDVVVGERAKIGSSNPDGGCNKRFPTHLWRGLVVIGKKTEVPANCTIEPNCIVGAGVKAQDMPFHLDNGECVGC
jgi:glucose-1-phosphate adenylyltransferase